MKNLFVLLVIASTFVACSKETKIQKNLWKDDGIWNIEQIHVTQSSTNSIDNFDEIITNYGSFTFKKDGSGIQKITVDGDVETTNFTYTNTTNILTLLISGETRNFDMDWEKNEMTLSLAENYTADGESITYTEVLKLKKK